MRDVGTVQRRLRNDAPGAEGGEKSPAPCHACQHRNGCRPIQPVFTCFHLFSPSFTWFHLISLPGLGGGHAANPISPQRDHNSPKVFYRRFPITRIRNSAFCILHSAFSSVLSVQSVVQFLSLRLCGAVSFAISRVPLRPSKTLFCDFCAFSRQFNPSAFP